MANKYSICSRALVLVGASPITSFAGDTTEEIVAETLYQSTLEAMLASHRWRFASQLVQLNRETDAPAQRWDASYALPPGTTVIYAVLVEDRPIEFDRYGEKIYCNAAETEEVYGELGIVPEETLFPPYFVAALELKLAAMFAIPIAEDSAKADYYERRAMAQLAQARAIESQGRTARKMRGVGSLRSYHGGRA